MTKYAKTMTKASILSLALTFGTVYLDGVRKSGSVEAQVLGGMAEFVVGMFALIAVVGTIVYLFVGDEA
jgi:hypothetical protein